MSVIPPGLYEGGDVDYSTTTTLRIAAGKYVVQDTANGFGMILRDPDATEIDCSSLFPVATQKDWYVGLRITYTTGSATTCEFFMTDVLPLDKHLVGKDELVFCQVTLHASDTGLNQATITPLAGSAPKPYPERVTSGSVLSTDREFGLLDNVSAYRIPSSDEKDALVGDPGSPSASNRFITSSYMSSHKKSVGHVSSVTISSNIKFQLIGDIYIGKSTISSSVKSFIKIVQDVYSNSPYVNSDGAIVSVDFLKTSNDITIIVPSTHADSFGFYTNPWVYLSVSSGSIDNDTVACVHSRRINISDGENYLSSLGFAVSNSAIHAEDILSKKEGNANDRWTLSSGTIQDALQTLLSHINDTRIDTQTIPTDEYVLLYRSGGIFSNNLVSEDTVSIYMGVKTYFILQGGFWDAGTGQIRSSILETSDVSILGIRNGGFFSAFAHNMSSGTYMGYVTNDFYTLSPWHSTINSQGTGINIRGDSYASIYSNSKISMYPSEGLEITGSLFNIPKTVASSSGVLSIDADLSNNYSLYLGENITSITVSNNDNGKIIRLYVSSSGSYTMDGFPVAWNWETGTTIPISFSNGDTKIIEVSFGFGGTFARIVSEF
jgi:hypothetical protein